MPKVLEDLPDLGGHKTPHGKVRQVIPAEAVEAARTVLRRDDLWELSDEEEARLILEAAAPHLTGAAWEEGYGHGYKHGYADCLKLHGHETKEEA